MRNAIQSRRSSFKAMRSRITTEEDRIQFLLQRDGFETTVAWVRRTLRIYRGAVLDKSHYASTDGYRSGFIESYCDFKRWLARVHASPSSDGAR